MTTLVTAGLDAGTCRNRLTGDTGPRTIVSRLGSGTKARIWKDPHLGWCSHVPDSGAWFAVSGCSWPTWRAAASHVLAEIDRRLRRPGGP